MNIIKRIISFITKGVSTWRDASFRNYDIQTDAMRKMREDVFSNRPGIATDKAKLREDRKKVNRDFRKAYNKYLANHEQETNKQ